MYYVCGLSQDSDTCRTVSQTYRAQYGAANLAYLHGRKEKTLTESCNNWDCIFKLN